MLDLLGLCDPLGLLGLFGLCDPLDLLGLLCLLDLQPQGPVIHRQRGAGRAGQPVEPGLVAGAVGHPIRAARRLDALRQGHADLRAEAGGQPQRVAHRLRAAARQVELAQVRVGLAQVGHRRHPLLLQHAHRGPVLDAHAHRVAGEALGVGDDDALGRRAEDPAQRVHLGAGRTAARRGVGLVRDEHQLLGQPGAVEPVPAFGRGHQALHDRGDVVGVQPGAVEGAVGRRAAQQPAGAAHAAGRKPAGILDHQADRPHAGDHAVAPAIEGQGGAFQLRLGGHRTGGQQPADQPRRQGGVGDVVGADHQHPPAAAAADPVLGHADAERGRGAGRVELDVGAAGADQLGQLGMAHGQGAEDELAIETVARAQLGFELLQPPADGLELAHLFGQGAQLVDAGLQAIAAVLAFELADQRIHARKGRGEYDAGLVGQCGRQPPALRQLGAGAGGAVVHHQRQAGVAQSQQAGGDRQLGGDVERGHLIRLQAELGHRIEAAAAAGQPGHPVRVIDDLEGRAPGRVLEQPGDALIGQAPALALIERIDARVACQQPLVVVGGEDLAGAARQPQTDPGHHAFRLGGRVRRGSGVGRRRLGQLDSARGEGLGRAGRRPAFDSGRGRLCARQAGGGAGGQDLAQRGRIAQLGMVGGHRGDVGVGQHVQGEGGQHPLGPHLDEQAGAAVVQGPQAVDPAYRRGHLVGQPVQVALAGRRGLFIGPGIDVGHHRNARRADVEAGQHPAQRIAGRGHDGRVEGVGYG